MIAELAGFGLAGLPAGSFVQRIGARRSMLAADAVRAPCLVSQRLHGTVGDLLRPGGQLLQVVHRLAHVYVLLSADHTQS